MKKILNILLILMMVVTVAILAYVAVSGGADESIGLTLIWTYVLLGFGIAAAIACAVAGMVTSSGGIKGTLISLILGIGVIAASYFFAAGHTVYITDIGNGGFFPAADTVITEASMLVIYTVCGAAVAAAFFSEIWGALK